MNEMREIKARLESCGGKLLKEDWRKLLGPRLRRDLISFAHVAFRPHVTVVKMDPGRCHANAYFLHRSKGYDLWTGFCLSAGHWVLHSWCFDASRWQIVDSIGKFEKYYGVRVSQ